VAAKFHLLAQTRSGRLPLVTARASAQYRLARRQLWRQS